jgi:hypothetical protein
MAIGKCSGVAMTTGWALAALLIAACTPEAPKEPAREVGAATATATATATASAGPDQLSGAPSAREGLTMDPPAPAASLRDAAARSVAPATIPPGSGDYAQALADATAYKKGTIAWAELEKRVLARKLPPHRLGCAYLMTPVPVPPPGVSFDPKRMPKDWEGTWGEVAMTYFAGVLTREELDKLHAVAHRALPPKH